MKSRSRFLFAIGFFMIVSAGLAKAAEKKLIVTGWDNPDTSQFKRDLNDLEKWPFDGVVIYARAKEAEGKGFDGRPIFSTNHWERDWFGDALADLKTARSGKITHNFLLCTANPGNVDWFDDTGWKEIESHWRILARLARDGGLKGLVFDAESYTSPFKQFSYTAQVRRGNYSFDDYARTARQRGRQIMEAVLEEFPNIVLLNYWLLSACKMPAYSGDNTESDLAAADYGLLPAFADGWFDILPPNATIIDGDERAYRYDNAADFNAAYVQIKNASQSLISEQNRRKTRAQLQVGYGIYLDAYISPSGSAYHIEGKGVPNVSALRLNVASALWAADQYVWIYGEKGRWWPAPKGDSKTGRPWPEIFAGCDLALLAAKEPGRAAQSILGNLRAQGSLTNLLQNGDFSAGRNGKLNSWSTWQGKNSKGDFSFDAAVGSTGPGAACLRGMLNGCFLQTVSVKPAESYIITAATRQEGRGSAWLRVRWQTGTGRWLPETQDRLFWPQGSIKSAGWRDIGGWVTVPEGAERLVVLLGSQGCEGADCATWFDDAFLVKFL